MAEIFQSPETQISNKTKPTALQEASAQGLNKQDSIEIVSKMRAGGPQEVSQAALPITQQRSSASLGDTTHTSDLGTCTVRGDEVTFAPQAGGKVVFSKNGDQYKINAEFPDGTKKEYPSDKKEYDNIRTGTDVMIEWLPEHHWNLHLKALTTKFSWKGQDGKEQKLTDIKYSKDGLITSFKTSAGKSYNQIEETDSFEEIDSKTGKKLSTIHNLGPITLLHDGLHAYGREADTDLGIPMVDEGEKHIAKVYNSLKHTPLDQQSDRIGELRSLLSHMEDEKRNRYEDKDGNGFISKQELTDYAKSNRHSGVTDGYFAAKQLLNQFDKLASSPNGLSSTDLEKALSNELVDHTIAYITKPKLDEYEQRRLSSTVPGYFESDSVAETFNKALNQEISKRGLKLTTSFGTVTSDADDHVGGNHRPLTVTDANGKVVHQIPFSWSRMRDQEFVFHRNQRTKADGRISVILIAEM